MKKNNMLYASLKMKRNSVSSSLSPADMRRVVAYLNFLKSKSVRL